MGWKSFIVVVKPFTAYDVEELLKGIDRAGYVPAKETTLEVAIYPDGDNIYIGQYQDCLIICDDVLSSSCLMEGISPEEEFLMKTFPQAEIGVMVLQSTVNFWGYALLAAGQKIRVRAGSSDDGTFVDEGAPLSQEMALLAKSTLDKDGQRTYMLDDFPDEPMTEDQMGEEFVFEFSKRFFGERLERADDLMFETPFQGYHEAKQTEALPPRPVPPIEGPSYPRQEPSQAPSSAPKPWWKFW